VFEVGDSLEDLANAVANTCIYLQNANIPFNVLIADRGGRVFVFPQVWPIPALCQWLILQLRKQIKNKNFVQDSR